MNMETYTVEHIQHLLVFYFQLAFALIFIFSFISADFFSSLVRWKHIVDTHSMLEISFQALISLHSLNLGKLYLHFHLVQENFKDLFMYLKN